MWKRKKEEENVFVDTSLDVPLIPEEEEEKKWYIRMFEPKVEDADNMNRQIVHMAVLVLLLFLGMIAYLFKFQIVDSPQIVTNSYNKRMSTYGENMIRGSILSTNGKVLAETVTDEEGNETRSYPYGSMFSHVVGIDSHGKTGLESAYNYQLLKSNGNPFYQLFNSLIGEKTEGDSLVTTLDTRLQKAAYEALGNRKGVVIAMEPDSGKILAMVSKPDFDPNTIEKTWDELVEDETNSSLVNRATQGLYPPGSTFKVLTTLAYMRENEEEYDGYSYNCEGGILKNGVEISCYHEKAHGSVDLKSSFAESCNTSFVNMGTGLDQNDLHDLCEEFLFNKSLPFILNTKKSSYELNSRSDKGMIPQTVIGQGETLMTPLHNLMVISAIANDGIMVKPQLAEALTDNTGRVVKEYKADEYKRVMTKEEALELKRYMRETVISGTAKALDVDLYKAAGKTGTAENGSGADHAWFVGFSGLQSSDLAVCVLVENGGSGSYAAVPIAKAVFDSYYNNELEIK